MSEEEAWKCAVPNCQSRSKRTNETGKLCSTHYKWLRKGKPLTHPVMTKRVGDEICALPNCGEKQTKGRWCEYHYYQALRGRPLTRKQKKTGTPDAWYICILPGCEVRARDEGGACQKHRELARHYGINHIQLLEHWGDGTCRICGTADHPAMDHDHACCPGGNGVKCGKCVRGLLCRNCNIALGRLEDSRGRLLQAVAYLDAYDARVPRS